MYKQVFDLDTGRCLDDPEVALGVFGVEVRDGVVHVGSG
jgi:nitrite reductase (NADH) small subunit